MAEPNLAVKWLLRVVVVGYLFLLIGWPVGLITRRTFAHGFDAVSAALGDPAVQHSMQMTAVVALSAVAINLVFGVTIALLLVRYDFPGKRFLSALIDVPLSVSPVVVGLALLLVFNSNDGLFGRPLSEAGIQMVFATPAMVLATAFVALPLVIREVVPVLQEIGDEQEQAARSLGASGPQTFWRITLPCIRWAVVYGVVLSLARSLGEFGAVKIVSGNIANQTQTMTLMVEQKYQNFEQDVAYASAFMLAFAAVVCLLVVALIRPKEEKA